MYYICQVKSKLKILHINKFPSHKGGSETVLFDTIRLLKDRGHDVIFFATDEGEVVYNPTYTVHYPAKDSSVKEKISYLRSFFYNKEAAKKLEAILEVEKPDIVHIHLYLNGLSQSTLPVLRRYRIPVVMTLHDYRQICPSYLLMDRKSNICEKCVDGNYLHCMFSRCSKGSFTESALLTMEMYFRRWVYPTEKYISRFVCVSRFQNEKNRQFNSAIASRSLVITNPVKITEKISGKRGDYLLYFGRLSKEKGVLTLLTVMKALPGVKLKIAGTGDLLLGDLSVNVELLGYKSGEELKSLIEDAAYTVVPSEWYETFGLSCAESLSLGTPVIASQTGALPELVKQGENGYLFTPKDAEDLKNTIEMAFELSDEEYYRMCVAASESVRVFSEENYIDKLLALYNDLLTDEL